MEVGFVGIGVVGKPGDNEPDRTISDIHAHPRPDQRQEQRFGDELAHDPESARAHGGADGKLVLTGRAAGQEQNRDVTAANREQQRDSPEKQVHRRS